MSYPPASSSRRVRAQLLWIAILAVPAAAQVPPGYYAAVDDTDSATLRLTLNAVIDDHQRYPYTSGATDTWDILEAAQIDPTVPGNILDVYQNDSHPPQGGGNSLYNREHTWPKSYGFPDDNSGNYPYTDCHLLFLCDPSYNSSRSNKPFRTCSASCTERPTVPNNGQGGGTGVYPGNSNWTSGSFTQGTWETWVGRRGDVARALLYADVRYEGGFHGVTGKSEPDLILTEVEALIQASNTGNNESVAYMGMLSVLIQWHWEDPPDALDQFRNDVVYSYQGNRNPFVDHPEWVDCLFLGACEPISYCTAGVSASGCQALLAASGAPSATSPSGFLLQSSGMEGSKVGLFFFGTTGRQANPWGTGTSFQCVTPPVVRGGMLSGSGTPGACDGVIAQDLNALWCPICPAPLKNPGSGATVQAQLWYRDPLNTSNQTTSLSNAIEFVVSH